MEMKLSVADRIFLLDLDTLPMSGNFLKMKVLTLFQNQLQFTAEELENWEIKSAEGRVTWNVEKARDISVTISETLLDMVVTAIEKSENINKQAIPTFEKFFELQNFFSKAKLVEGPAKIG